MIPNIHFPKCQSSTGKKSGFTKKKSKCQNPDNTDYDFIGLFSCFSSFGIEGKKTVRPMF